MENAEIERVPRMKLIYPNKCTVVRFTKFKDKYSLLNRPKRVLNVDSSHRVH